MKPAWLPILVLLCLLSGCGDDSAGFGSPSGEGLDLAAGVIDAPWLEVDLQTGARIPHYLQPDLGTARYRSTSLILRRIPASTGMTGSPVGGTWAQADETRRSASTYGLYLAVFETTRSQWRLIAGTSPWLEIEPAALAGSGGDSLPASGLGLNQVNGALAGWAKGGSWRLPTASEWELCCRAGGSGLYSWGDAIDEATVARFAVLRETAGGATGARAVGGREPNALGLYDMHGNLAELVADGSLRGASWNDALPMARSANRLLLPSRTTHALAGARLVYAP